MKDDARWPIFARDRQPRPSDVAGTRSSTVAQVVDLPLLPPLAFASAQRESLASLGLAARETLSGRDLEQRNLRLSSQSRLSRFSRSSRTSELTEERASDERRWWRRWRVVSVLGRINGVPCFQSLVSIDCESRDAREQRKSVEWRN